MPNLYIFARTEFHENSSSLTTIVWKAVHQTSHFPPETIFVFADKEGPISCHILHYLKQGTREEIPAQCCYSNCPSEQAGGQWSDAEGKQQLSINTDRGPGGGNAGTFTAIRHYGP